MLPSIYQHGCQLHWKSIVTTIAILVIFSHANCDSILFIFEEL